MILPRARIFILSNYRFITAGECLICWSFVPIEEVSPFFLARRLYPPLTICSLADLVLSPILLHC